jgi:hypothetical protein
LGEQDSTSLREARKDLSAQKYIVIKASVLGPDVVFSFPKQIIFDILYNEDTKWTREETRQQYNNARDFINGFKASTIPFHSLPDSKKHDLFTMTASMYISRYILFDRKIPTFRIHDTIKNPEEHDEDYQEFVLDT